MPEPKRAPGVPETAWWDDDCWVVGARDGQGNKHEVCQFYRLDGSRSGAYAFEHATLHGPYRRWHETGEVSEEGTYVGGSLRGLQVFHRATGKSTESPFPSDLAIAIVRTEYEWSEKGMIAYRWFDGAGRQVDSSGQPVQAPKAPTKGTSPAQGPRSEKPPVAAESLFVPRKASAALGYIERYLEEELRILFPGAAHQGDFWAPPRPLNDWLEDLPAASRRPARALDDIVRPGRFPLLDHLNVAQYGFDFAANGLLAGQEARRYVGLSCNGGGDGYALELGTGRVCFWDHEADQIVTNEAFESLDVFAWTMLRVAAVYERVLTLAEVEPLASVLDQPAGARELRQAKQWAHENP